MIVTNKSLLRIALLVLLLVLLQNTFFSLVELAGTSFWILPACAVVFGLLGGSMVGATVGFSFGFLADGLADGPLGSSCLIFMAIGYLAGLYRERGELPDRLIIAGFCGGATVAASLTLGIFTVGLGFEASLSASFLVEAMVQGIYGFLLGVPIYAFVRRALRPALVSERQPRRRPDRPLSSSGGLSGVDDAY
ncbi:MAG: rod shape-determining protein MreD [Thermoleophilia bacterium]|nr:rod shape-determining protein MreD [Thermoleophilia bacterium]